MSRSTRSKNKKLTKAEQKELDLNKRLDSIVDALSTLKSQNDDLKDEFSEVKERLDAVEGSSEPAVDVAGAHGIQGEPEAVSDEDEVSFKMDKKLRKSVQERLLGMLNSDTSDSDDDLQYSTKSKSSKKNLKKSGKLKTAQHKITRFVDWPHMYVFRRDCNDGVKYDSLSQMEFMNGYLMLMKREKDSRVRSHMYEHLINLTDDASQYSWPVVRNFHSIVLCMMESNRLEWHQTSKIDDLRRQYVWTTPVKASAATTTADVSSVKPCPEFQTGKCQKSGPTHNGLSHVCSYCLRTAKKSCQHAESECRRKAWNSNSGGTSTSDASKNARGGEHP